MIKAGEKPEEYRRLCPHWCTRIMPPDYICEHVYTIPPINAIGLCGKCGTKCTRKDDRQYENYTHVRFHRGYTSITMTFEIESIIIGQGREEWGAEPDKECFVIKLKKEL